MPTVELQPSTRTKLVEGDISVDSTICRAWRGRARYRAEGRCCNCGRRELPEQQRTFKLCEPCLAAQRKTQRSYARRLRDAAFEAYGGPVCACCGERERSFLCLDHVNGDGAEHRRAIATSAHSNNLYAWLKREGYPAGFQALCQNCNVGRWRNGRDLPARGGDAIPSVTLQPSTRTKLVEGFRHVRRAARGPLAVRGADDLGARLARAVG